MKKMFVALLFVVSTIFSASANTVTLDLSCGKTVNTDSSCLAGPNYDEYIEVMEDIFC